MTPDEEEQYEMAVSLQKWYRHRISQLKLIVDNPEASMKVGDSIAAADTPLARGIRAGVSLAIHTMGELPVHVPEDLHLWEWHDAGGEGEVYVCRYCRERVNEGDEDPATEGCSVGPFGELNGGAREQH